MKSFIAIAAACLLLLFTTTDAAAQTRGRRTTTAKRRAPAAASRLNATEVNNARLRVADQIKTLNRFLYLYGRASKDIETTGAQAGSADVANRSKASLLASIRNVRAGLDQLEADFRMSSALQNYYQALRGVSQRAANAEDMAASNQLDQAGRALIEVVSQLTDVLLEMQ